MKTLHGEAIGKILLMQGEIWSFCANDVGFAEWLCHPPLEKGELGCG
jgi:hypothetical protein